MFRRHPGFALVVIAGGCSVPEKQPLATDAAVSDAPPGGGNGSGDDAPDTTITEAPVAFSRQGAATFGFASNDATARFVCSIDGDVPVPCTSPYTRTLGDGSHLFVVRAINAAGRGDDSPAEHLWTIDTVAPDTTFVTTPPPADNSVIVRFAFDSNEHNVAYDCSLDNAGYVPCTSGDNVGPIGDGAHSFAVRAHDRAGNTDPSPAVYAWTVDTSTPDTQILSGVEGSTASTSASFTFISPDAGSGATFQCALDGAAFAACTSPRSYTNLIAGQHAFAVRVHDAVGNVDPTPAIRSWVVDLTPPDTTITGGPNGLVMAASAIFTFTSNEEVVAFQCSLDTAGFAACTSPFHATSLAQGPHAFAVRAIDAAGNTDATAATRSWTVDTVAPGVAITAGPAEAATSGPHVAFAFTASDGIVECSFDGAPFVACASPLSINLPSGDHDLRVRATDSAGNVGSAARGWTVACVAPSTFGAAGLLHLDDAGQVLANAVAGGVSGTLGDDATVELVDPAQASGRFGGGLTFDPIEADHASWPASLGQAATLTIEVWANPDAPAGLRRLFATADGRIAIRAMADSPTTTRFSAALVETGVGGQTRTATSAVVAAGRWHHVLISLAEPTLRLWVDGVRTETTAQPGTPVALDVIRIGGDATAPFSGSLDEFWIAQTAITSDDAALDRYCPL